MVSVKQTGLPPLSSPAGCSSLVADYLSALQQAGFTGELATSYADRLTMATDNSIYQLLPQAILFPRSTNDVVLITQIANQPSFQPLRFVPRGGGTGTNGQALNDGIVVDMSRHMNQILEFNPTEGWVRVEAGVVKDQLNQYLKPYGYFFSPELSTSNRATIGGMINTDASGQGSLVYGKTSDHVRAVRAVTVTGDQLDAEALPIALAEQLAEKGDNIGQIYHTVLTRCRQQRQLIVEKFPPLNRFLTGYDLKQVLNDDLSQIDLTRLISGSEGTLALVTEATLSLTPIPKVRRLVNIKYDSFDSALRSAPFLLEANALSVETVDAKVLNLAREDIIWHSVSELITAVPNREMQGLNIVEFAGDDQALIDNQLSALCQQLQQRMDQQQDGIIGYQVCSELSQIERIYAMRKKAVGLLGNTKGSAKPIPFVEDTCVPPQHLADYITEFRALLDSHQLSYGMFGHVDAGVLHVRPALDMTDPEQEQKVKQITDQVVQLTAKYGGLLWGEHGKGFRAEYSHAFFGDELYQELREIKAAFDPLNRLNPGKICTPAGVDEPLIGVEAASRGSFDRQIPQAVRHSFNGAMECNGNGLCFNFDRHSTMCPSMKLSQNRLHSPKGRAALVREWLRLLAEQGVDPLELEQAHANRAFSLRELFTKLANGRRARKGLEYDFSHEVNESMAGCLACKACATQCPIKIDVPHFRARFLQLYHSRYPRPIRDYLVSTVENYAPVMAKAPRLFNFFLHQPLLQRVGSSVLGVRDLPLLSSPSLKQQLAAFPTAINTTLEQLELLSAEQKARYVLLVQDPFTSYYDAKVVADFVKLAEALGLQAIVLPFSPNGKAQHIKGFLQSFARTAKHTADFLNRVARLGIPMVGVDPALVLCYRDEYRDVLAESRGKFTVLLVQEWLIQQLDQITHRVVEGEPWYLLGHCTETSQLPESSQQWQRIFNRFGAQLQPISVGCCGMAGIYGHESRNYDNSVGIYQLSWQQVLASYPKERCLATGYSCRSQVQRLEQVTLQHPLQALLEIVK